MDSLIRRIREVLSTDKFIKSAQIADIVGVSEKTVRTKLKQLDWELQKNGAELIAKQGQGYLLKITNQDVYTKWSNQSQMDEGVLPGTSSERINFILAYLLNHVDYIKLEDLSMLLCVSRNTITADLKQIEYILAGYHLSINRRPNYGIRIEGSEMDKRICIANCLLKNNMQFSSLGKQKIDSHLIAEIIRNILQIFPVKLSESAYESLIVHIYVSNGRILRGHVMTFAPEVRTEMIESVQKKTIDAAKAIAAEIQKGMNVIYSDDEIIYLAMQLSSMINADSMGEYGSNLVISSRIDELVLMMLNEVYETNKLDFKSNLELRMSLNQHLVPLDIRMRYNAFQINPILDQIRQKYAFAYTVAATACTVLSQYYGKEVPEDEIGYIAVIFALAIEKKDKVIRKRNIVMVCVSGRGSTQLFIYRYKQAFGKYINKIYESTVFNLEKLDFKALDIDYVFTTVPLNIKLPVPIFEISFFLDHVEIDNYVRIFEGGDSEFLYHYFDSALFIPDLCGESKEEILYKMSEHAAVHRKVPENFYELVMKREKMGQTDFGNLVAIPHPYRIISNDNFVVAAVLEKPIWWGHNDVQLVLLISLSEEEDENIEHFYRVVTKFLSNRDLVQKVIEKPCFYVLIEQLQDAGKR